MNTTSAALIPNIFGNNNPCNRKMKARRRGMVFDYLFQGPLLLVHLPQKLTRRRRRKGQQKRKNKNKEQEEEKIQASIQQQRPISSSSTSSVSAIKSSLDEVNPVGLGRRSRQIGVRELGSFLGGEYCELQNLTWASDEPCLFSRIISSYLSFIQ